MADEMADEMVVIVTGANRGIGKAICELILKTQPKAQLYATSRQGVDSGFQISSGQTIYYEKLDVSSTSSIQEFADVVKHKHASVQALINNAGYNALPEHSNESVEAMLDINFRGTVRMATTFLPFMKENGRIVNLSSTASSLSIYSKSAADEFRSIKSLDEAEALATKYQNLVASKQERQNGFGGDGDGYPVSKALVNAITKVLAASAEAKEKNVLINACCPGWISTDMGNITGWPTKKPADGAKIPVRLAFGDITESGKYWANDGVSSTQDGKVQPW